MAEIRIAAALRGPGCAHLNLGELDLRAPAQERDRSAKFWTATRGRAVNTHPKSASAMSATLYSRPLGVVRVSHLAEGLAMETILLGWGKEATAGSGAVRVWAHRQPRAAQKAPASCSGFFGNGVGDFGFAHRGLRAPTRPSRGARSLTQAAIMEPSACCRALAWRALAVRAAAGSQGAGRSSGPRSARTPGWRRSGPVVVRNRNANGVEFQSDVFKCAIYFPMTKHVRALFFLGRRAEAPAPLVQVRRWL